MQKFEIIGSAIADNEKTYLLNKPFHTRVKDDDFRPGRISSYHQHDFNEPDWLIYPTLPPGQVKLSVSKEMFTSDEALSFMGIHNGIALTRDNLFMVPAVFPNLLEKLKQDSNIVAFMGKDLIPKHLNKEAICPMLTVADEYGRFDYDWHYYSEQHRAGIYFMFYVPCLRKTYY